MKLTQFKNISDSFQHSARMPVLFIGHGNPMNALYDNVFTKSLKTVGENIRQQKKPQAILVVSAHWLTNGTYVCANPKPETIHDFDGFPDELFAMQYPASGSPEYAKEVVQLVSHIHQTDEWGLDHGAWTILKHLFPEADVPVFQVSIDYHKPMQYHVDLAQQLQSLREKGVLIIGSGNIVHNLRLSMERIMRNDEKPYEWAIEFDEWVKKKIIERDFQSLVQYEKIGTAGALAVPTVDHYVPMLYSIALAKPNEAIIQTYEEVTYGALSMRCFQIG